MHFIINETKGWEVFVEGRFESRIWYVSHSTVLKFDGRKKRKLRKQVYKPL